MDEEQAGVDTSRLVGVVASDCTGLLWYQSYLFAAQGWSPYFWFIKHRGSCTVEAQ